MLVLHHDQAWIIALLNLLALAEIHSDDNEIRYSSSITEKRTMPRHDLMLDRLSEFEQKKLIVELVRIQNDGTAEVDFDKSVPVASELLEFRPVEGQPIIFDDTSFSESKKSIPSLKIAIHVIGAIGDVQPFLAMAKRLQELGHHVRLATHANFKIFVQSTGADFFRLGGDPWVLAGYKRYGKE